MNLSMMLQEEVVLLKYKNVQGIAWTKGIVNPRTFDCTYDEPEKTKKKRKRKE